MKWTVDRDHAVHTAWCKNAPEGVVDYNVVVLTGTEMLAGIASGDYIDGHHGPSILRACDCVDELAMIEREKEASWPS